MLSISEDPFEIIPFKPSRSALCSRNRLSLAAPWRLTPAPTKMLDLPALRVPAPLFQAAVAAAALGHPGQSWDWWLRGLGIARGATGKAPIADGITIAARARILPPTARKRSSRLRKMIPQSSQTLAALAEPSSACFAKRRTVPQRRQK
jgi:hypothetical protein